MSKSIWRTWLKILVRRFEKWQTIDPEWQPYMPDAKSFRYPSPSSKGRGAIPKQEFMKDFKIRYYDKDAVRSDSINNPHRKRRPHEKPVIETPPLSFSDMFITRDQIIYDPPRLRLKETVGPFYGNNFERVRAYMLHEAEDRQIYTYVAPGNILETSNKFPQSYEIERKRELASQSVPQQE